MYLMKLIVVDNPQENGGGYVIRTDDHPAYFEYQSVYRDFQLADKFASRLNEILSTGSKLPVFGKTGWVLKEDI